MSSASPIKKTPADCPILVLAAGFGKRLGELTRDIPKPLVPVAGRPLIDWTLEALRANGFKRVFINLHYRGDQIYEHVTKHWSSDFTLTFVKEPLILETGGAIKNIEPLLQPGDHLFTVNADTLFGSDLSFTSLLDSHLTHPAAPYATLVVQQRADAKTFGELGVTRQQLISHFIGHDYQADIATRGLVYLGIQVLSPKLFPELPPRGTVFSITRDTYVPLLQQGKPLTVYQYPGFWSDVGTPTRLAAAVSDIQSKNGRI